MSIDVDQTRTLFEQGHLTITATALSDEDANPDEADCYTEENVAAWKNNLWAYVGMDVRVLWAGREIGQASLWSIEHGQLDDNTYADAWKITPAAYEITDGQPTTTMGSPLSSVIVEALGEAATWLMTLPFPHADQVLARAQQWADPSVGKVIDHFTES